MAVQPMAEVFGFKIDDLSDEAMRHRRHRLCPFNNIVPSCTKDKLTDPLGVCSIYHDDGTAIVCPVRFRERWHIATDAAEFFFSPDTNWTWLKEIRLNDANGRSAGNIDLVLVSYDDRGRLMDFGALEVQGVYISGNIRRPFEAYMKQPEDNPDFTWAGQSSFPRADFLSSSRKRLAPQLIYKGGILHAWHKKMAVAVDQAFFAELPVLHEVDQESADVAWLIYDLVESPHTHQYELTRVRTAFTKFTDALSQITMPNPGSEEQFRKALQKRLDRSERPGKPGANAVPLTDVFDTEISDLADDLVVDED